MLKTLTTLVGGAALAISIAAAPAQAAKYVRTFTNSGGQQLNFPTAGPAMSAEHGTYYDMKALANYGELKVSASVSTAPIVSPQESALAEFADEITINAGAAGTAGVATFRLLFDGDVYAQAGTRSYWVYQLFFDNGTNGFSQFINRSAEGGGGRHVEDFLDVTMPFISGQAKTIIVRARVYAGIVGPAGTVGEAYSDFGDTVEWGGLLSAVTSTGQNVTRSTTISSATGYDYQSTPGVPEPASWALMILGFGAAGGMLRRRRALA